MLLHKYLYLFVFLHSVISKNNKQHYQTLQVKHSASEEEIQTNYERIIRQLRQTPGNQYQIQQVERAYGVLKDRAKRSIYDLDGEEEVQRYE